MLRRLADRQAYGWQEFARATLDRGVDEGTRPTEARAGAIEGRMGRTRKRDPRTDPAATLADFVYRISRIGLNNATRVDFPLWTVTDIRWAAVEVEKLFNELKDLGWARHEIDPLERVLHARWAAYRLAHAMRHKTSNMKARQIVARANKTV